MERLHDTESAIRNLAENQGKEWRSAPYYDLAEEDTQQQWVATIQPLIEGCDFSCVVDLAAGHGRHSARLAEFAERLVVVDILQENIDFCRQRFAGNPKFQFIKNNGVDLQDIPTGSVSMVFCFDAMVHFDSDIVRNYLRDFKRVLKPGGRGFCHHSNYSASPGGDFRENPHWRNFMSRELFCHYCVKEGLAVVESRVIDWSSKDLDCLTLFENPV